MMQSAQVFLFKDFKGILSCRIKNFLRYYTMANSRTSRGVLFLRVIINIVVGFAVALAALAPEALDFSSKVIWLWILFLLFQNASALYHHSILSGEQNDRQFLLVRGVSKITIAISDIVYNALRFLPPVFLIECGVLKLLPSILNHGTSCCLVLLSVFF